MKIHRLILKPLVKYAKTTHREAVGENITTPIKEGLISTMTTGMTNHLLIQNQNIIKISKYHGPKNCFKGKEPCSGKRS